MVGGGKIRADQTCFLLLTTMSRQELELLSDLLNECGSRQLCVRSLNVVSVLLELVQSFNRNYASRTRSCFTRHARAVGNSCHFLRPRSRKPRSLLQASSTSLSPGLSASAQYPTARRFRKRGHRYLHYPPRKSGAQHCLDPSETPCSG